jgi:hypothetical protein
VVEMCNVIGTEEGVKYHDKGKHATHEGLDKFMKHIGLWYVNTMKASDMVYTKGCGCVNAQPASQPAMIRMTAAVVSALRCSARPAQCRSLVLLRPLVAPTSSALKRTETH